MTIGVAVIGMGFMGRTHASAYQRLPGLCRLAAVFDTDPARLSGLPDSGGNIGAASEHERIFDPAEVFTTTSLDALLARPEVHAVSVCTPTDTHASIASRAMQAGKHVLVEKPVSLDRREIESLAEEAARSGRVCMPAMCMRFWPEWAWLTDRVRTGGLGEARSLAFERLGTAPAWGHGFYDDPHRSGGALHDLHIHDTDFICAVLGRPFAVTSVGDHNRLTTFYHYADGPPHVVATGGWLRGGLSFRMRYIAEFEGGTADFDLARDPSLWLTRPGSNDPDPVAVAHESGYDREIRAFLETIEHGRIPPVTLIDAMRTLEVLQAEARSLRLGRCEEVP